MLTLRGLVKANIEEHRANEDFVVNGFEVRESYLPVASLTDIPPQGIVWIIGLAKDDRILTRGLAMQSEIPIQVAFQRLVADDDLPTMDLMVELAEQLRHAVKNAIPDTQPFAWLRNEALRDQSGTPYNFAGLRERSTFESIFTAYFQVNESG